ncbi:MAG: hypothetical protein ACM3MK_05735 [Chitinophagales bacterium]
MANPLNIFVTMKAIKMVQSYFARCPKCGHIFMHRPLKVRERLRCKKCGEIFRPD